MLDAITFDYWNTLVYEGPDALVSARLPALDDALRAEGHEVEADALTAAHLAAFGAYQEAWRSNRQYCVPDAVGTLINSLGIDCSAEARTALMAAFTSAGHAADLRLIDDAAAVLRRLHQEGVKLAIVCDVGLTPTPVLTERLAHERLLDLFDSVAFSDEVGVYKPDAEIFRRALAELGADPSRSAHVGDRLRTDVAGARALGMVSVRFRGIFDDPDPLPEADYVIDHLAALQDILWSR